ncbi:amidase (plasmid) [Azospirillum sp. B510]|uniref:amidase n=1 Tax=Azospirillum sp. (strain B510) TaxID=137722 RepID=UPI0001C4C750|nr:amidase [Azospirillum sp. B510]BAI75085.1 amidase [Azospirillum sp. B510]
MTSATIFVQALDIAPGALASGNGSGGTLPTALPTVAIKDTIDIAGTPTRAGSRSLADAAPAAGHAEVVGNLLASGWRIVGKTTMHELAFGTTGINRWAGTAPNPRFPAFVPGGSSSGSAAAVAAGLADAAIGTDTGGSVRIPAACCGVFGLKPTFGRVSRHGVMPAETSLDCVGPFAADMDRLSACMAAIDPTFGPLPAIDGVTIGLLDPESAGDVDGGIAAAVRAAVGSSDLPVEPVALAGMRAAFEAGLSVINVETWAACAALVETGLVGEDVAVRLRNAARTTAEDLARAEAVRAAFTAEVDALLARVAVIALPTMAGPPPLVADAGDTSRLVRMTTLVRPFNLSGHPAIAIPLAAVDGAPASLQLVAAKGADELLCAVAAHIAARLPAP